ncbi:MAG: type I 3-dehydroquinate dehydratase [Verrucomicrobiota bacterium]|nr:type I 3-dehydroquinate dehydratase [Verrucomicrobiota bacterium]
MTTGKRVKARSLRPQSVGVIFSKTDLQRAFRLRRLPDLFELRLDGLVGATDELRDAIPKLRVPFIVTARSAAEGGANNLSLARRRELLLCFLPGAAYVDVELRSASGLSAVLKLAHARKVRLILSLHDLKATPTPSALSAAARRACSLGADIFKLATRTDRLDQLNRLLEFLESGSALVPISVMGIGKLGRVSRARLAQAGSVLNYAHLGRATIEGQWSLAQLRTALEA